MAKQDWKTLDTEALVKKRQESTTSGNVQGAPVPLGKPMRPPTVSVPKKPKK